jgi:alpha-mannosidase
MKPESEDNFALIIRKLQEKYKVLTGYQEDVSWKFFQGECLDAFKSDFDDSSWELVKLPMTIDVRKGEAWLRSKIVVPQEIVGVDVFGSVVKLASSVLLDKTRIFVNSEKVFSAEYWTELRCPKIVLDEEAKPQTSYVVAIHVYPKFESIGVPSIRVTYSHIEKIAFELDSFIQELRFAKFLDEKSAEKVSEEFDLKVFEKKPLAIVDEIEKARVKLSYLSERSKEFKVHLVAHAHIDMNWLWPWEDTVATIKNTFGTMVKLMDKYPDFHFSHSQAVTYKVVEENFPELFEAIKRYVKRGNWDVTASMWTEADLNMVGTEALVRQFLEAKRYVKEKFGIEPRICWEPDTFGHIWTLPQVLRKAGGKYYYFMRCGKGDLIFWWEAPDGSKVLAFTSVYNNFVTPKNIVDLAMEIYNRYGLKTSMFVYGVGNHGGGATIEDIEAAHEIQKKRILPKVVFSSTQSFFEEIEKKLNDRKVPVVNDELQFVFDGCYTTHGDIKRYNRLCERLLVDAEKFSALFGVYPREALHKAWLNMLFNQFHDILDGSGTSEAYIYPKELAQETLKIADETLKTSLKGLAEKIKFSKLGVPIVVFNSLSWDRLDVVSVNVPKHLIPRNPVVVSADNGKKTFVQVSDDEVLFMAEVPPIGYRTYYLVEGEGLEEGSPSLTSSETTIENEYFKVEVEKNSGMIKSLYDKVAGKLVFKKDRYPNTRPIFSNLLQVLYELPHSMSAWIIGDISRTVNLIRDGEVELVETGPVKATIKVVHQYRKSKISQYLSLCRGVPRIDFYTVIDWKEISNDEIEAPMLKVSFTPILGSSKATFEIPFGYIERVADGTEVPALRWIDLSDGEYGLSLLNDSKYGFDVKGNTVRMTLVRTSYSPDPRSDQGVHEVKYSIYPHKGGWKEALTFRKGYEINHPLETFVVTDPSVSSLSEPEETSFIRVKPDNVIVSCVKLAEDSDDYILRIYDAMGIEAEVELLFGFNVYEVYEVDVLERKLNILNPKTNKLRVLLQPFEIKTIRIKRSASSLS